MCVACLALKAAEPPKNPAGQPSPTPAQPPRTRPLDNAGQDMLKQLDAPLLFVKRHSYTGIHIYDTFYKWPPGGGGIYVLENPQAPRSEWKIRPVIDPTTPGTLGHGVYTHPELSWDARKLLFCFKGSPGGSTMIYEIGVDGQGLRRVADPTPTCSDYKGVHSGQHDIAPAYLPDGRIVFLSTRPSGLVPCANEGVSILHVMNADGSGLHPISVNNVNEFDPSLLPDGRILFGRWEYVDKNALTIQSLWTIHPDGTEETAFFANNMVLPEAILDARPVPDSHLIIGTFAKHNASPRGSIALIDPRLGKNGTNAIINLEHPENPTCDTGESCEPWPLSEEVVLFSGRPAGFQRNVIQILDRAGHKLVLLSETNICLHSPMLVKPRPQPAVLTPAANPAAGNGRFFVQDIYRGLEGVKRGAVKWLRVIEETSRVSPKSPGENPYNQTFLVSAALAFSVKNYLGIVPVDEQGSAYFEAPSGRALYFQALDADGRLVQSMRTFVQAAPGVTRSCIGCHEPKAGAPPPVPVGRASPGSGDKSAVQIRAALSPRATEQRPAQKYHGGEAVQNPVQPGPQRAPARLQPESWGSGFLDYSGRVQPILDKHCVGCHGGAKGIAAGLDLSGGWTEHFNISYENLVSRRETQLVAYWIAGIDCMNGTAYWSSQLFRPRAHGSGASPLASLLVSGHGGRIRSLSRAERDLILAWIDSNGLYNGTWDYTENGCATREWKATKESLIGEMRAAACMKCHGESNQVAYFDNDWFNLKEPELSRILRAPLARGGNGLGLGLCRDRKADPKQQRIQLLRDGYAHAIQPVDKFARQPMVARNTGGEPAVSFSSTADPHYQKMLAIIRSGRDQALAAPRADMPGAELMAGACRQFNPPTLPPTAPALSATGDADGVVHLAWEQSSRTIGLQAEIHRSGKPGFAPSGKTQIARTGLGGFADKSAPPGRQHYALVLTSGSARSKPSYAAVSVRPPGPPPAPLAVQATPASCSVRLGWQAPRGRLLSYNVYRGQPGMTALTRLTRKPIRATSFSDGTLETGAPYSYVIRAVSARGMESDPARPVTASAVVIKQPVFATTPEQATQGRLYDGETLSGKKHGQAASTNAVLEFAAGGHVTFPHRSEFDLGQPLSIECWAWFDKPGKSPVLVSCGEWRQAGWFLQRLGEQWRWHVGGLDCDGGKPPLQRWVHLAGTFDGQGLRLYADGVQVAEAKGDIRTDRWPGELHLGQYSAGPGPDFQMNGRLAGLKVYHRPLTATEIADAARTKPGLP
jgi:mono/diheme cytochrome c family protein